MYLSPKSEHLFLEGLFLKVVAGATLCMRQDTYALDLTDYNVVVIWESVRCDSSNLQ